MNESIPINIAESLQRLRDAYRELIGTAPDAAADMICEISAERALSQDWEWQKVDHPNWPVQLVWK